MEGLSLSTLLTDLPLNLLNILLLYLIISRLVYRPVKKMLDARAARLAAAEAAAAEATEKAQEQGRRYEALIAQADQTAQQLRDTAAAEAAAAASETLRKAEAEADEIRRGAKQEAARKVDQALSGMQEQVAGLAADIATKVLERTATDDDTRRIAKEFFAVLDAQSPAGQNVHYTENHPFDGEDAIVADAAGKDGDTAGRTSL